MSEKPLDGFHIVVDAGNGAGGFFVVSKIFIGVFMIKTAWVSTKHASTLYYEMKRF